MYSTILHTWLLLADICRSPTVTHSYTYLVEAVKLVVASYEITPLGKTGRSCSLSVLGNCLIRYVPIQTGPHFEVITLSVHAENKTILLLLHTQYSASLHSTAGDPYSCIKRIIMNCE